MEDELLNQLAQEAQRLAVAARQDPSQNLARQRALNRLLTQLMQSGRLAYPPQGQWSAKLYLELKDEALSRTLLEIARRIEDYRPEHPILAWVNNTLRYRFKDVERDYYRGGLTGVPRQSNDSGPGRILSLDDLNQDPAAEFSEPDLLHQFILDDPEQKFNDCIRGRPRATFRFLLLARLEGKSWEEISQELGDPSLGKKTLSSFFNRELCKSKDYFQRYLSA